MFRKKAHNKKGEDDEIPIRQRVREFMDGRVVTLIMTSFTLFALFGDDFRLWFFAKIIDVYFFSVLLLALLMFLMEIMINSCVQDDFKYSFFFWLDIIATISLAPDIEFLVNTFQRMIGFP